MLVISFGSLFLTLAAGWSPKLGLDLAGGTQVVLTPAKGHSLSAGQLAVTEQIIRNRVAGIGVSGATVQTSGNPPQVIIQVPGIKNAQKVLGELVTTAQLLFRPVECFALPYQRAAPVHGKPVKPPSPINLPPCQRQLTASVTQNPSFQVVPNANNINGYTVTQLAPDPTFTNIRSVTPLTDSIPGVEKKSVIEPGLPGQPAISTIPNSRYVLYGAVMNGTAISSASAQQTTTGQWVVNCGLTAKGSVQWDHWTQVYFHGYMAVDLDGVVQSAPLIQPQSATWSSFQGQVQISGSFTQGQANALAIVLQYGSLPVPLQVLTYSTVSPTLGHDALVAGLGAGLAGLAVVMLYVLLYYRLLGLVVLLGLAVTAALLWAIISALGQTSVAPAFDLAGVTGLIVSIGITVDSYIVYFERLKDETRSGRSVRTSLDRGFASAWRTVLAADTVSLLAAVLLYFLAAGSVQGFAFFLGLSTLLDIIVTWFFTRPAVSLLGRNERLTSLRGVGVARGLAVRPGAPA
ncbi:MAG TPA: protein translocase subunit SecD [Acidimicrobiales bacterium]|nr:protein translocase subunit SecD [Acidimicrobiales bacterium]